MKQRKTMRQICVIASLGILSLPLVAKPKLKETWSLKKGFSTPESTYYDADSKTVFVSNVDGAPNEKDGKGYISQLSPEGKVLKARWADKLDAPKGMRTFNNELVVSDLNTVKVFNKKDAKLKRVIQVANAKFLNDIAIAKDGTIYVSDMFTDTIHMIAPNSSKATVFVNGPELESPNGLLVVGDQLIVAAWGEGINPADFGTKKKGSLYSLDLKTKKKKVINPNFGALDGLELVDEKAGKYLVSDWKVGKVFLVDNKTTQELVGGLKSSADIGYIPGSKTLLVPEMTGNTVRAFKLSL